ncbi:hypothetical protein ABZ780_29235 [Micromonospora sp. NPDC047467]|uniref:hypothetical protein n=1 Tax=Micromonospora sp. NPDC047467 TaxID=3154814 RepID=UPI0033DED33A
MPVVVGECGVEGLDLAGQGGQFAAAGVLLDGQVGGFGQVEGGQAGDLSGGR